MDMEIPAGFSMGCHRGLPEQAVQKKSRKAKGFLVKHFPESFQEHRLFEKRRHPKNFHHFSNILF
ncbi:hypothetical protein FMA36_02640 [Komagataeibacter xylinus]|uniref:Uncharacterized protein n=1 Tax=Komagataeibacter xylinus TaxID=28448 RepID=A0A857FJY7_KOMXY|nr:hypothetical protein FMA36_02640 [Komagataeibacter xylinus]